MSDTKSISVLCISPTEQSSKALCEKFTNQTAEINGLYTNKINDTFFIATPRWPNCSKTLQNTVVSDGLIITAESLDSYKLIESYVRSKERVSALVFISSSDDIKNLASSYKNGRAFDVSTPINDIRNYIFNEQIESSKSIRMIFDTLDTNKSGFLEKKEILNYARDNGDNVSSTEFLDTLNIIDRHGHGKICFDDFEKWWKMGGHNNSLFSRLVRISDFSKSVILNDEKFQLLKSELKEINYDSKGISSHLIKLHNDDTFQRPGFQLFMNLVIGGSEKENIKRTYLERHNELDLMSSTWLQFVLKVEENEIKKVKNSIRFLKNSFFELLERSNRQLVSFIRSFFEIEDKVNGSLIYISLKLKRDIQEFFENALLPIIKFFDLVSGTEDSTFQFLLDFQTDFSINDILHNDMTVSEAINSYILEIKANLLREHLRKLSSVYKFDSEIDNFIWLLTSTTTSDFNCQLNLDNLLPSSILNLKLGFVKEIFFFYMEKYGLSFPFFNSIENIEVGFSFCKLFMNGRMKVK